MKRAICIGLNYPGSAYQLGGCVNDAVQLANEIQNKGGKPRLIKDLLGASDFLRVLEEYKAVQKKADTLYITYSGHGTQYPGPEGINEGLCFWNGRSIEVLSDEDFNRAIKEIPGTVVVIFDSCFSGGMERAALQATPYKRRCINFNPDTMQVYKPIMPRATAAPNKRVNMFACSEQEVSWDTGVNGLFTLNLLNVYDAGSRTVGKIMQRTYNACKPNQHPTWSYSNTTGNKRIF